MVWSSKNFKSGNCFLFISLSFFLLRNPKWLSIGFALFALVFCGERGSKSRTRTSRLLSNVTWPRVFSPLLLGSKKVISKNLIEGEIDWKCQTISHPLCFSLTWQMLVFVCAKLQPQSLDRQMSIIHSLKPPYTHLDTHRSIQLPFSEQSSMLREKRIMH